MTLWVTIPFSDQFFSTLLPENIFGPDLSLCCLICTSGKEYHSQAGLTTPSHTNIHSEEKRPYHIDLADHFLLRAGAREADLSKKARQDIFHLGHVHEPLPPVRLVEVVFSGVSVQRFKVHHVG